MAEFNHSLTQFDFCVICFLSRINLCSAFLYWYPGLFLEIAMNVLLHMILDNFWANAEDYQTNTLLAD